MSRAAKIDENIYCPKCGKHEHQVRHGKNKSGSQKYQCNDCNIDYTPKPYPWQYSEKVRGQAIRTYYSGASGRKVGLLNNFNKSNVYNWIKSKTNSQQSIENVSKASEAFSKINIFPKANEIDEMCMSL